jgi:hypothetical protein
LSRNEKLQAQAARWDRIIKTGVAFEGSLKMFDAVETGDVHLLKSTPKRYVEVVHIDRASPDMIKKYSVLEDHEGNVGNLLPLGKVHFKAWEGPGHFTPDITEEEENTPASYVEPVIETLWIEDNILEHFFLGMKMEVETTELDIGLTFIEEVHGFFCSFYTVLPNEKMLDNWKEPGKTNHYILSSVSALRRPANMDQFQTPDPLPQRTTPMRKRIPRIRSPIKHY